MRRLLVIAALTIGAVALADAILKNEGVVVGPVRDFNCVGTAIDCTRSGATAIIYVDAGTGGGVTSVTASAPIASSGGATPNITITSPLPIANGGTNSTSTPTAGALAYGDGTSWKPMAAGTAGYVATSNGSGVPTWGDASSAAVMGTGLHCIMAGSGGNLDYIAFGGAVVSCPGATLNHPVLTTSALRNQVYGAHCQTAAGGGVGSTANIHAGVGVVWRGNSAGLGGFRWRDRLSVGNAVIANYKSFFGLQSGTGGIGTAEPSTLATETVYFGSDSGQTTFRICSNNGANSTATCTDLGASFPTPSTGASGAEMYDFELFSESNGSTIDYWIRNGGTGATASGSLSSDIPAAGTLLNPITSVNNGATATAFSFRLARMCWNTPW